MAPLFLAERDVAALLSMEGAVDAVQEALELQASGRAHNCPRQTLPGGPHSFVSTMRASIPPLGLFGFKTYTNVRGVYTYHVYLYDLETGRSLAIVEAEVLGRLRTGAATAVAARYMARTDSRSLGLIGSGFQARGQLEALAYAFPLEEVRVFSRHPGRREAFAREMSRSLAPQVRAVGSPAEATEGADLVVTATSSPTPVLKAEDLPPGSHVSAVGGAHPYVRELDEKAVLRAEAVVVDDVDQARRECGELMAPASRGLLPWERVRPLWQVAAGQVPGRRDAQGITLYKSLGIALWDVAAAGRVYREAVARGMGTPLPSP